MCSTASRGAFDPRPAYAREQAIFGRHTPFYGWHYPPFFLVLAGAAGADALSAGAAVWQGVTLRCFYLALVHVRAIARSDHLPPDGDRRSDQLWLLLALAFPAVFVNLGQATTASSPRR